MSGMSKFGLFGLIVISLSYGEIIPSWHITNTQNSEIRINITMPELTDDESFLAQAKFIALNNSDLPIVDCIIVDSSVFSANIFPNLKEKLLSETQISPDNLCPSAKKSVPICGPDSVGLTQNVGQPFRVASSFSNVPICALGRAQKFRDLLVAPLVVKPFRYDKKNDQIIFYKNIELKIKGIAKYRHCDVSSAFDLIYRNTVLNYESFGLSKPQGYLIIVPDEFYNNILPLARWKEQKGWYVTVTKLSQIGGNNRELIKNYIANAFQTWQIPPEYVLLVGSKDKIQSFQSLGLNFVTDYPYSLVSGNDNLADVLVGRLPADNASELDVMVAKIIGYEKTPYLSDTLWYHRGLMVATTYQEGGGRVWTALETKRWVREKMLNAGFGKVDTVFHDPPYQYPNAPETIRVLVNAGVSIINGRGWGNSDGWQYPTFYRSDVQSLANGWKLPVITSIYCGTGNFNANPCFGEVWLRAGTPTAPKGGVAFFGASWMATSTRFNNCIDYGIYWGIFQENITDCASAMYRGKIELMNNFPLPCDSTMLRAHLETYNLLGDPSLQIWTAVPKVISVEHRPTIPIGGNYFPVRVTDYNGQPLSGALVSLWKASEVKEVDYTDASGFVALSIKPTTADTMFITVTKPNRIPYCGIVRVNSVGLYVGYYDHTVTNLTPGQVASLSVTLKNYGQTQTAYNTWARISTNDPFIHITDSVKNYGDIGPGSTATSSPFQFYIAEDCPNNHPIHFQLSIQSGDSVWYSGINISVLAPFLTAIRHQIIDGGNGYLDPGETADLIVWLKNSGPIPIANTQAILRTLTNAVSIIDSIGWWGTINPSDSTVNSGDRFRLFAQPTSAIGRGVALQLLITGDGFQQVVNFSINIGYVTTTAPFGPDAYGYFAYDNTDLDYPEHPEYFWVEIDPNFGGNGSRIQLANDDIKTRQLPFTFRYYGQDYNRISIASNGYIAMDSAWLCDPYNWHIPSAMGPPALVAPFWDDLRPDTLQASGVYYYYDATNHRFIVEWSRVHHIHGFLTPVIAELLTFQTILFDPAYYPTLTGDGEIIFQYYEIVNDDSATGFPPNAHNYATCGIENYEHTTGLEYTFANRYPPSCAPLTNGRAIKFTTDPPDSFIGLSEFRIPHSTFSITALPNPFTTKTTIKFSFSALSGIGIYDITGKLVKSFSLPAVSDKRQAIGGFVWDGTDRFNRKVAPGLYFVVSTKGLCPFESPKRFFLKTRGDEGFPLINNNHKPILKIIKLN
uniref:Gingipain domain-containing protein n=1 Tax=candidate division WOR-3 bacterium TaxID=2052148 RepID=A0A7C6A7W8_UNCW3